MALVTPSSNQKRTEIFFMKPENRMLRGFPPIACRPPDWGQSMSQLTRGERPNLTRETKQYQGGFFVIKLEDHPG